MCDARNAGVPGERRNPMNPQTDTMSSWKITAVILSKTADWLANVWQQGLPPRDFLPSGAQEALCDEWCGKLAADVRVAAHSPVDVQPWVLVRLMAMAEKAEELDRSGLTGAPNLTESTLRSYLIDEWHKRLGPAWKRNRELRTMAA